MPKRHLHAFVRTAMVAALALGAAERAAAASILIHGLQVQVDVDNLFASITAGLEAVSDDGSDVFLDGIGVSLAQDGVEIPDLFTGPTLLDDLPFFLLPLSLPPGGLVPVGSLLFRITGLAPGASYAGSFSLFQFGADGSAQPLVAPPQEFAFTTATAVPEPASVWLLMAGAGALLCRRRARPVRAAGRRDAAPRGPSGRGDRA